MKRATGKWMLFIIAFIVSCLIWYVAISNDEPRINIKLNNVKVELLNSDEFKEKGYTYYIDDILSTDISVNVLQKKGWLISADCFKLTADADKFNKNTSTIPIKVNIIKHKDLIDFNYKLKSDDIYIRTEKLVKRKINIDFIIQGEPDDGYGIGNMVVSKKSITVELPKSKVNEEIHAEAIIDISNYSKDYNKDVDIVLYDKSYNEIDCQKMHIFLETNKVNVNIPIGVKKEIPIKLEGYTGQPYTGYGLRMLNKDLESVIVIGNKEDVKNINSIVIPKDTINVQGKKETFSKEIDLKKYLPDNIVISKDSQNVLYIESIIEKLSSKKIYVPKSSIIKYGIKEGLNVQIKEKTAEVTVMTFKDKLDNISESNIQLSINLNNYDEGTYNISVSSSLKNLDDISMYKIISSGKIKVILTKD